MSNKNVVLIIIALIVTTLVGFYIGSNSKLTNNNSKQKFLVQCYTPNDEIVINKIVDQVRFTKIWILTLEDNKETYFNGVCKVTKF